MILIDPGWLPLSIGRIRRRGACSRKSCLVLSVVPDSARSLPLAPQRRLNASPLLAFNPVSAENRRSLATTPQEDVPSVVRGALCPHTRRHGKRPAHGTFPFVFFSASPDRPDSNDGLVCVARLHTRFHRPDARPERLSFQG